MFVRNLLRSVFLAAAIGVLAMPAARADEEPPLVLQESPTLLQQASASVEETLDKALDLIGIRYRRGGMTPERGFDCSGFVNHVFREGLGLYLPRSAKEMSRTGEAVAMGDLKPGDLVFFNTMRRSFSHVGIYLGDNQFIHAPARGREVEIATFDKSFWQKRFNG
ncbi:MAG TPA: C40 family peptidase, partial [Rhodocyclaceae bacterium]|nr:C40 family peptidase [Rhodocyclaceae bacterium]